MRSKKLIIILIIAFVIISISIFLILNYKKLKVGNTIVNQSEENIINSILNKEIIVEPSPFVIRSIKRELDHKIETCDDKEMLLWIKDMLMAFNGNKKTKVKPTEVSCQ